MVVGCCIVELYLPGVHSLKAKRRILKSIIARLHKEFNVSCAEVALNDVWQSATLGISVTSNSSKHANNVLEKAVYWVEYNRPDIDVLQHRVEVIHVN